MDLEVIGQTVKGRDIYLAKYISNPNNPTILFLTQQHGNEQLTTEGALEFIKHLGTNKMKGVLDKVNILVIPMLNADGAMGDVNFSLDDYVEDVEDDDADILWNYSGNTALLVNITDHIATITVPYPDWYGQETICFIATDTGGLNDSTNVTFTVLSVNDPPLAYDDWYQCDEDTNVLIEASGVLLQEGTGRVLHQNPRQEASLASYEGRVGRGHCR